MRVIFMGKDKGSAIEALELLLEAGDEVVAVVAPMGERSVAGVRLADAARGLGLRVVGDEELYRALAVCDRAPRGTRGVVGADRDTDAETETGSRHVGGWVGGVDLVISFLFWKRIRRPLIELPRIGCVNFHPAPLPDYRGLGGYNVAVLEALPEWGVSAHFVDESFDTGELIEVRRFAIDPDTETAYSLERKSQRVLVELFRDVVERARAEGGLEGTPQGDGRYISREEFERMRRIRPDDSPEQIERKIRAFWYPPYRGATIELGGHTYTVVNDALLREIAGKYHGD